MAELVKVVVDAMGGDLAPVEPVQLRRAFLKTVSNMWMN